MKLNKIYLMLLALLFVGFTSCKDNERETETFEDTEAQDEAFNERLEEARGNNDVLAAVRSNAELSTFAEGLLTLNVEDSLETGEEQNREGSELVIFAPTNLAYSQVHQNDDQEMLGTDSEELTSYHIVRTEGDMRSLREEIRNTNDTLVVESMQGEDLKLSLDGNDLVITGVTGESARVTDSIEAGNGMVYIIDRVLMPRDTSREVTITDEG